MDNTPPAYDYVAYIDESGDPGLETVKPIDRPGSSEWIVVAGVVIRAENEPKVGTWIRDIMADIGSRQMTDLHFRRLNPAKKLLCCGHLAKRDLRCFVVASNKQNMRKYKNPWAERIPSDSWFYCWLTRLLLERITHFVQTNSIKRFGAPRLVKIEYSERGGLSYSQMNAYYTWLRYQSQGGRKPFLPLGNLRYDTIHPQLMQVHNHASRDGLKLPDIVAGSFFKAVDIYDTGGCDGRFAEALRPRMARFPHHSSGQIAGYGVKVMPKWRLLRQATQARQRTILEFYGYPSQWWDGE